MRRRRMRRRRWVQLSALPAIHFDVLDVLGLARLETRSPTLGGSIPLRAAQACVPLLEGNAYGLQVVFQDSIVLRRGVLSTSIDFGAKRDAFAAKHRAALQTLVARGLLPQGSTWVDALRDGPVRVDHRARTARIFTGLLVKPATGLWLRLSSTANRRSIAFDVGEAIVPDATAFTPLVLDIALRDDVVVLEGEVATLAPLLPGVTFERRSLVDEPGVGRRHLAFYNDEYFADKKQRPTLKYRAEIREAAGDDAAPVVPDG